jgi:hypothetical protein
MDFTPLLDFLGDIFKASLGALFAFVLYNINNKRSEARKLVSSQEEKIVELREDRILQAIIGLDSKFIGKFDSLEGKFDSLEGKFDSLEGKFDTLNTKVDSMRVELITSIGELKNNQISLVTELRTLKVIEHTPVLK